MAEIGELIGTGEQKDISDEEMVGLSGYVRSKYQEAEDGRHRDRGRRVLRGLPQRDVAAATVTAAAASTVAAGRPDPKDALLPARGGRLR